jgi:hypothetical protein
MSVGIVTRGLILRALGEYMRKFMRFPPRTLRFRSLLILAGAFALLAAFTPRANADLIAYFNFNDNPSPGPPDYTSEADQGLGVATTITTDYDPFPSQRSGVGGLALNVVAGDLQPNIHDLVLANTSPNNGRHFDIPLITNSGFFSSMTVTFAYSNHGNGFTTVTLSFSTDGGVTFSTVGNPTFTMIQSLGPNLATLAVPTGANNAPLLVIRLVFTGGTSNGNNIQTEIDNIQINGTIVPEPATVAGGLLGVLGLCWFQRRRLIRSLRLRRA